MEWSQFVPRRKATEAFCSYFEQILDPADMARASAIFDRLGFGNEHMLACQLHLAGYLGKINEVLAAYEKMLDPTVGYFHMIPNPYKAAVEVRMLSDVIFQDVMIGHNEDLYWHLIMTVDPPDVFADLNSPDPEEQAPLN